jgi:hypothetical protein
VAKKRQPMLPGMPRNRDLLTPQARYKKGYTPERQAEIADALKDTEVDFVYTGLSGESRASEFAKELGSKKSRGHEEGLVNRTRRHVVSGFANSSIKPERLGGLKRVDFYDEGVPVSSTNGPEDNPDYETKVSGLYNSPEKTIKVARGLEHGSKNRVQQTLRHELGHHITIPLLDKVATLNPEKFATDEHLFGAAEGLADNFAHKTAGKTFKGRGTKKSKSTYAAIAQDALGYGNDYNAPESDINWAKGYAGAVDSKTRDNIFHTARTGAQQLEIGFGQH